MKKIIAIGVGIVVIGAGFTLYTVTHRLKQKDKVVKDYKNIEYVIAGKTVALVNGVSETEAAPGSASKITTRYFGNEVRKDLDGDGREDVAFLLTQETGGSGTYFYVVAALATDDGYRGTQGVLLGDRIAPQTTESGAGRTIIVNYADRKPGEPMTVRPSWGKSLQLLLDAKTLQFGEVVRNFEGEADSVRMTLGMKKWIWQGTAIGGADLVVPHRPDKFTLTLSPDGTFSATTDCNGIGGNYTAKDGAIIFDSMISTQMFCEGSQEGEFRAVLENAIEYSFTSRGELVFDLKGDRGAAIFR